MITIDRNAQPATPIHPPPSPWTSTTPSMSCMGISRCRCSMPTTTNAAARHENQTRHAKHACHDRDRENGLVRAHEFEHPDGIAPVSRANQAAARERMSRSSRSCLFSRRSRVSSSRSAAASPSPFSSRRPSYRSACVTQWQIDCAVGSNSRARSAGSRPARTNSSIWRRNSGE